MNTAEISQIVRDWSDMVGKKVTDCPPDVKFVTGDYNIDRQLYYFEQESGIALHVTIKGISNSNLIDGYEIVDEKKYAWFLLRWAR